MNNFDLPTVGLGAIAVVPIIVAICQAIKMVLPDRLNKWMPFFSMALGIIIGFLADHNNPDLTSVILSGVLYGLASSGLYSGIKTTAEATTRTKPNH